MNKETSKQRRKLSADSLIKTGKREEVELTEQQLSQASGGKHLAGVKYEDITVNCGKKRKLEALTRLGRVCHGWPAETGSRGSIRFLRLVFYFKGPVAERYTTRCLVKLLLTQLVLDGLSLLALNRRGFDRAGILRVMSGLLFHVLHSCETAEPIALR